MTSSQPQPSWDTQEFPCTLNLQIPFPTPHLASIAQRVLSVDEELSPLVTRRIFISEQQPTSEQDSTTQSNTTRDAPPNDNDASLLHIHYAATTNRMLRVAVNGFISSVGVVLGAMKELDIDVVYEPVTEGMEGVQGLDVISSGG